MDRDLIYRVARIADIKLLQQMLSEADAMSREGRSDQALKCYQQALADVLHQIAVILLDDEKDKEAKMIFELIIDIYHNLGSPITKAKRIMEIGEALYWHDWDSVGLEWFEKALTVYRDCGEKYLEATTNEEIGCIVLEDADGKECDREDFIYLIENALHYFNEAKNLFSELSESADIERLNERIENCYLAIEKVKISSNDFDPEDPNIEEV